MGPSSVVTVIRSVVIGRIPYSRPACSREPSASMSTSASVTASVKKPMDFPRPSASLVVVNERNEVLLVQRNPQARFFAGVHVFPGGNLDNKQDESLAMTAIRETFEESGLLLASSPAKESIPNSVMEEARHAIHQQKVSFLSFLAEHGYEADVKSLLQFTEWITPIGAPRRFHTQFFVAFLPAAPSSGFSSGAKQDRVVKPDGGQEVISARFVHPKDALAEFRDGNVTFMPPQFYILATLADVLSDRRNTARQRARVEELSRGMFGHMVINPRRLPLRAEDAEGRTILTYEGDETRGGSKGRLHRAYVKFGKGGVTKEIVLERNFDIFTEMEPQAFSIASKL